MMKKAFLPGWRVLLLLMFTIGCDASDKKTPIAPRSRSQAVMGPATQPLSPSTTSVSPVLSAPHRPRKLCSHDAKVIGNKLVDEGLSARARAGLALPARDVSSRAGQWLWVNFWAAWCAPCKEEIPRLLAWERKLNAEGVDVKLVFISLDDDERQLDQYLANSAPNGLGATLWLREGKERAKWLESVGMDPDPELPAHLLVSPRGSVQCAIQGAVDDADYEQLKLALSAS